MSEITEQMDQIRCDAVRTLERLEGQQVQLEHSCEELKSARCEVNELTQYQKDIQELCQGVAERLADSMMGAERHVQEQASHHERYLRAFEELRSETQAELDAGLRRLAHEVSQRIKEDDAEQQATRSASEQCLGAIGQLTADFESNRRTTELWRSACDQRHAMQEMQLVVAVEGLRRLSREMPQQLDLRLAEVRRCVKEDLTASALSTFKGEMKLWAKMAQLGQAL